MESKANRLSKETALCWLHRVVYLDRSRLHLYLLNSTMRSWVFEIEENNYMIDSDQDNRFFKVILSSIADGVFTVDENRCITSFNPAAERITGTSWSMRLEKNATMCCTRIFVKQVVCWKKAWRRDRKQLISRYISSTITAVASRFQSRLRFSAMTMVACSERSRHKTLTFTGVLLVDNEKAPRERGFGY